MAIDQADGQDSLIPVFRPIATHGPPLGVVTSDASRPMFCPRGTSLSTHHRHNTLPAIEIQVSGRRITPSSDHRVIVYAIGHHIIKVTMYKVVQFVQYAVANREIPFGTLRGGGLHDLDHDQGHDFGTLR